MPQNTLRLDILETLYRFDEPLLFVAQMGTLNALFLKTDETEDRHEFLSCYVDKAHVAGLKDGRVSIRGVYELQSDLSVVTTDFEYSVGGYASYDRHSDEILARLPESGVGILPRMGECPDVLQEKDALLSIYFKGAGLERDRIGYQTLMDLLGKVQKFAKNVVAPPELRGLRASTFDFTIGDPALGSLMISIKDPEFDLEKVRQGEKRRDMTRDELTGGVQRQRDELFADIENLAVVQQGNSVNSSDAYYSVRDLLPTDTTPYQSVTFSTNAITGFRSVSIDTARADFFRAVYDARDWTRSARAGVIVEINANSYTCLLRSPRSYRVTTCAFDADIFEGLQKRAEFKIGSRMDVSGDFIKRKRRDLMQVRTVDAITAQ